MDMYYGTQNRKKQEVVMDTPITEPINEEAISEKPNKEHPKTTFLDRFLKMLGNVVEKID